MLRPRITFIHVIACTVGWCMFERFKATPDYHAMSACIVLGLSIMASAVVNERLFGETK